MQKPSSYDQASAQRLGEFKTLPPGGYVCRILKAQEETSKNGNVMLVLYVDIAEGEYAKFFEERFKSNTRPDKKYPAGGIYRQSTDGKSAGFFKALIADIENSNPGYKWDWNEAGLKGKYIGGIFGEEEYQGYDENSMPVVRTSVKMKWTRSISEIRDGDFEIPKKKLLKKDDTVNPNRPQDTNTTNYTGSTAPDDDEDDLPF